MIAVVVIAARPAWAASRESTAELLAEHDRLTAQYVADMEHMAHVAYSRGWSELGDLARLWRPEPPASGLLIFVAPDEYAPALPLAETPEQPGPPLPLGEGRVATGDSPGRGEGALSPSSDKQPTEQHEVKPSGASSVAPPPTVNGDPAPAQPQPAASNSDAAAASTESSDDTQPWWDKFRQLRREQADALFALAGRAAEAGERSLAFTWATETLRENPDHAGARRVLGYTKSGDQWLTEYGGRMAAAGKTWSAKYGWIAPADVARYDAGERLDGGVWISADDDARRHARLDNGWQVRTDHFLVTTNHSLAAAAGLAARLERLYQVWRQLFAGFYLTEREVRQLFAGDRDARQRSRPFHVFYHRDRDGYNAALVRRQPRIAETLGIYFDVNREAHFFAGDDQDTGTLYHEAVHQLFQESRSTARHVGELANFWVIEGIATYFETLTEHDGSSGGPYYTIGEATAGRLPAARRRLLEDGYYLPLARFVRLDKSDLQRRPDLPQLYSQAAGMATFLMDGGEGLYREPLVRYLVTVYSGRDDARSLARATGQSYRDLDGQYRRFLESLP